MERDNGNRPSAATVTLEPARDAASSSSHPVDADRDRTGTRVGRFELRALLGRGGMGAVYRARDVMLERDVALKLLRDERGAAAEHARLMREAKAMAKLSHPNLVTVYDAGASDGEFFIAMELVEGTDLRTWHGDTAPSPEALLDVFTAAGHGLQAAHDAGIVHRDFKPANVLVSPDGAVMVADFGIAMMPTATPDFTGSGDVPAELARLTRTGGIPGTPRYMSPEQHLGDTMDARSDQFSFAVSLAEALNGEPPFSGTDYRSIADSVLNGTARLRNHESAVGRVLARALARDPDDRFPSMTALLDALTEARRVPKRSRVAVGALAVGAAVTLGIAMWWFAGGASSGARSAATAHGDAGTRAAAAAPTAPVDAPPAVAATTSRSRPSPSTSASASASAGTSPGTSPSAGTSPGTSPSTSPSTSTSTTPRASRARSRVPRGWRPMTMNGRNWKCPANHAEKRCISCCKSPGKLMPYPDCGCYWDYAAYRRKYFLSSVPPGWKPLGTTCGSTTVKYSDRPSEKQCLYCCAKSSKAKVLRYPDCRCFFDYDAWKGERMLQP